jgi:hypothetical protein
MSASVYAAAVAGVAVADGGAARFSAIFVADAACTLLFAAAPLSLPRRARPAAAPNADGYREVLRDRPAR